MPPAAKPSCRIFAMTASVVQRRTHTIPQDDSILQRRISNVESRGLASSALLAMPKPGTHARRSVSKTATFDNIIPARPATPRTVKLGDLQARNQATSPARRRQVCLRNASGSGAYVHKVPRSARTVTQAKPLRPNGPIRKETIYQGTNRADDHPCQRHDDTMYHNCWPDFHKKIPHSRVRFTVQQMPATHRQPRRRTVIGGTWTNRRVNCFLSYVLVRARCCARTIHSQNRIARYEIEAI